MDAVKRYNITEKNCNGVLSRLYNQRDAIGARIDKLISMGRDVSSTESDYDSICSDINEICNWRRDHDCLLEGDPVFSYY